MNSKMETAIYKKTKKLRRIARSGAVAGTISLVIFLSLSACKTEQVFIHGAIVNQDQIDLVPVGSSRDQVLLSLGSPSTTGNFGSEVFYYISQSKTKKYAWQKGTITDQRVFAVYFDEESQVAKLANYGLQDGKVFDFISRTTPTGGKDSTFLGQLLQAGAKPTIFQ